MDPFTIASLVAMVAGAALQQKAASDARRNQQRLIQENLMRQQGLQQQAEQAALARAQDFAPEVRQEKQQELEQQATEQMIQPVEQSAQAMQDQSAVQGNVSQDYAAGRARSQAEQLRNANALASVLGKITGAGRLRTNEALGMAETGQLIDRLKSFSQGSGNAAQIGISRAGQPSGGTMLAGGLLQAGGSAGLMSGLGGAAGASNAWSGGGLASGAGGANGISMGSGGLGLKTASNPLGFGKWL
ncbi:hypothetical protein AVE30378_01015 [Achromobacter veterisilvae]|uniref:Uncharacterized protein n=1 Tax=Achromobacter veterisilvae TaxID=2069367 RepID=A0A446C968_9BURK|nr:hypothetical protein [Achromobacter veterisilvae]SSW64313.1 hypothetical protein AVE30378_01015 [Achromobacter veterisilvae]